MRVGLFCLLLAYALSQFFRAFLAVLAPALQADVGAGSEDLAFASGLWFLVFAAMQIPVGAALDGIGPRRTAAGLFALGAGGGALVFSLAQSPLHITLAMALIGVGCAPVLMASYFIFARVYPVAMFATLAGAMIGFGSLGNIAGSAPMAWAVEVFGWRQTMAGLGALSLGIAAAIWVAVEDPARIEGGNRGSVLDVLKIPALWPVFAIMFVNYTPAAGLRGLWAGPYAADVFGADARLIGQVTLVMSLAMVAGNFAYGPLDRLLGTRKWVIFGGNLIGALACLALFLWPDRGLWFGAAMLAAVGFFGASFPMVMAHGKAFLPAHLTGRGVTLMNLFGIGGVGIVQMATGPLHAAVATDAASAAAPYSVLFGFFGLLLLAGLAVYLFARDRTD